MFLSLESSFSKCTTGDDVLLMMTGRFVKAKDHETLIKSLVLLPDNYKLLLVGEGKREKKIKQVVNELKLDSRVLFLGFRNDIQRLMKTVHINILSSHWEGLPLVSLEGMASGRPFVGSRIDTIEEVIKGAGVLFKSRDEKDLSAKILELIKNKDYYNAVSQKCSEKAKAYDIKTMVNRYLCLYKKMINEKEDSTSM